MEHFYEKIENWFTFPELYKRAVNSFDNAHFVEIGCWKGGSATFMGVEIFNSHKNIKFDCIDNVIDPEVVRVLNENIKDLKNIITFHNKSSLEAVEMYDDNSLDFVFIDSSHEYEETLAELKAWYPKVKSGGIFAGHDYPCWPGVKQAVDEFFVELDEEFENSELSWIYIKK